VWPLGHLALGYVAVSLTTRVTRGRTPDGRLLPWILIGSQLPDLVDKPLAWYLGAIPSGRMLGHSVFVATVVVWLAVWLGGRLDSPAGTAFGVAYVSHLFGDAVLPAIRGDFDGLSFLFWPALPPTIYAGEGELLAKLAALSLSGDVVVELQLAAIVVLLWVADGAPGVYEVLRGLYRRLAREDDATRRSV
jgi:membrane-bound metal-dependent hydrolase YbcI (DUF457 family)